MFPFKFTANKYDRKQWKINDHWVLTSSHFFWASSWAGFGFPEKASSGEKNRRNKSLADPVFYDFRAYNHFILTAGHNENKFQFRFHLKHTGDG